VKGKREKEREREREGRETENQIKQNLATAKKKIGRKMNA
jgi:hypothetical protein